MKVVLLGKYPIYSLAEELGLSKFSEKRVTSWNENLAVSLSKIPKLDVYFITSSRFVKKTITVRKDDLTIIIIRTPPKTNVLTLYKYLDYKTKQQINTINPDIVHGIGTEHIWGYISSKYSNSVLTIHGVMNEVVRKNKTPLISLRRYFAFLERQILKKVTNLIVINPYVKEILKLNKKTHLFNVENAVSSLYRESVAYPGNYTRILFIGDFNRRKNVLDLLHSLSNVYKNGNRNFSLLIIGNYVDKEYKEEVDLFLQRNSFLKELIVIKDFVLPNELVTEIKKSAFLVLTSNEETAPMVIAESMTMGLPIIATNVGGVRYMVQDGINGFIIDHGDIGLLEKKINELLSSPSLRKIMGDKAREDAFKRYSMENIAQKTYLVYKEILDSRVN